MTIMGKVIKWQTHRQEPVPSVQALQLVPGKPGSWSIGPVWENFMDVGRSLQSVVMHQKRHSIKTTRTGWGKERFRNRKVSSPGLQRLSLETELEHNNVMTALCRELLAQILLSILYIHYYTNLGNLKCQ